MYPGANVFEVASWLNYWSFCLLVRFELQARGLQFYLRRDSGTDVSCEFCEIFLNICFYKSPSVAASVINWGDLEENQDQLRCVCSKRCFWKTLKTLHGNNSVGVSFYCSPFECWFVISGGSRDFEKRWRTMLATMVGRRRKF